MKTKTDSVWAWAILEKRGDTWYPWWPSISGTRADAIKHACDTFRFSGDPVANWRKTKKRFDLRVAHVKITPQLFGKELEK